MVNRGITQFLLWGILYYALIFQFGCSSNGESKDISQQDSTEVVPVEVEVVTRSSVSAYYSGSASLEAESEARVVANVSGIIKSIFIEEGDWVERNQVLAKLDDRQFVIEAKETEARLNKLQNEYERKKKLYDKQLISAETFDEVRFEYESQRAVYEKAQLNLAYTQIKAPIGGVVSNRMVKEGNMIVNHEPLFTVTDFDPLLAVLHVPEQEISNLQTGQKAVLTTDVLPGKTFTGSIQRISPVVDPSTGTVKVTVRLDREQKQLKPGMFSRIRIIYQTHDDALVIPKDALINEDEQTYVYQIENGRAFRKKIHTGYRNGTKIEVLDGIGEGVQVVTIGQRSLNDSTLVEIINL